MIRFKIKLLHVLFPLTVLLTLSCAAQRLERLKAEAVPFDEAEMDKAIPAPKEVPEGFEVTDRVEIKTTMGTMIAGLYGKDAPVTVANFLNYVDSGFYSDKIFHRVIPGFMIQGGGFDVNLTRLPTSNSIPLELIPGAVHDLGVLSMARTNITDSATSQFFVCVAPAPQLNGEYAIFGKLEEGFDVAINISQVESASQDGEMATMDDVPVEPVVIEYIKRIK